MKARLIVQQLINLLFISLLPVFQERKGKEMRSLAAIQSNFGTQHVYLNATKNPQVN